MAFKRRDVPIDQCACPFTPVEVDPGWYGPVGFDCKNDATGEDRLCDYCRDEHDPDGIKEAMNSAVQ